MKTAFGKEEKNSAEFWPLPDIASRCFFIYKTEQTWSHISTQLESCVYYYS